MANTTYVKVIATQEFHELECELFGRVYLKDGLVLHTNDVMFYTKEQMDKEIEIKSGRCKANTNEIDSFKQWLEEIEK